MELTKNEIIAAEVALRGIATQKMQAKSAYAIGRLFSLLQLETKRYYDARNELIKKHGVTRPATSAEKQNGADNEVFEVQPDTLAAFSKDAEALAEEKVAIDKWLLTFTLLDGLQLSPNDAKALTPLITGPVE